MLRMNYSIAIDGPAGAGKSTIAKVIAKKLNFIYVDTGAMYRAMGLLFLQTGVNMESQEAVEEACSKAKISIRYENGEQIVVLNDENVNGLIRTEEAGKMASTVAKNSAVRMKLVELQRELASTTNVIMDGRDIGTHVLPNANLKVYLTASSLERAKRRWTELTNKGVTCSLEEIEQDIIARDEQDMNREISPLCQAQDAILLDTSFMNIEEVVDAIIQLYNEKQ